MTKMPNVFVIGAPRCATTSLYDVFSNCPQIFVSPEKEPKYFGSGFTDNFAGPGDEIIKKFVIAEYKDYLKLFQNASQNIICDFSTDTLFHAPESSERIFTRIGDAAKIIVILRNPFTRAISGYNYMRRDGRETQSFFDAVQSELSGTRDAWDYMWKYISASLYYEKLKCFNSRFPSVLILLYEEMVSNWEKTASTMEMFLGLDYHTLDRRLGTANPSGIPKNSFAKLLLDKNSLSSAITRKIAKRILPSALINHIAEFATNKSETTYMIPKEAFDALDDEYDKIHNFRGIDTAKFWRKPVVEIEDSGSYSIRFLVG